MVKLNVMDYAKQMMQEAIQEEMIKHARELLRNIEKLHERVTDLESRAKVIEMRVCK